MKPQYQRSNQALKAYYKCTIPCQSSGGSQLKYRKKTEKQVNIHQINDLNKSNEDIDWLQKIVNGFQWYKDKLDPLFLDGDDTCQTKQYNNKREIEDKSIHQICNKESVCLKSKGEYSQRGMDNKIIPSNNSNRSNQNKKSRQLKNEVFHKNSSFGKNIIAYRVKNKRSDSQTSIASKKKECSISISQLTAKGQKVMDMEREKERQRDKVRQESKQKDREKRQRHTNQYKKKNMDQTQKICDLIEVCGITDINDNILKMKTKLSMQQKNVKLNSKIASIKAERKNLRQVITEQKSNYGKIIKNKSVDLKQRSKTTNSVQNPYKQNQRYQIEDKYRPSLPKQKSPIQQKSQEKYLVQQFNGQQEYGNKFKQNEKRKAQGDSQKKSNTSVNFNINNQIEKLMLRQRDLNISILNTIQNQTQKPKKVEHQENVHVGDKQNENSSIRKQNENKKYYYLLEKSSTQQRQQKIFAKKQRRLNSSFGQRKLIYNYNEQKPIQPLKQSTILRQNSNKEPLIQNQTSPHVISCLKKQQASCPQVKVVQQKVQQDYLNKQNFENSVSKKKILESSVYRNVKFVQSTKNSQVWTDHSMSIVLDKHLPNPMEENQDTPVKNHETVNQQWNILDIFSKLDCRKLGILSANNCSIEYVSREIRYILGPVLEQILYKNTKYNFTEFIQRVQNTLQHVKDSQFSVYEPERYLKIKEWAPETQRVQESSRKYDSNELAYKSNTSNILKQLSKSPSPSVEDSVVKQTLTKKYEYTKTFYQQVNTQPSIRMKKKENKEVIRFATFQDQDMTQQENDGCFVFKDIEMSKSKTNGINQFEQEYNRISNQSMEQKLQKKLATLNLFQSTFGTGLQQKIQDDKLVQSIIKSRCRSDAQKTEYKNQIVKLQLLNQRLQRYLHDQTLKQYSTSKLLNGEI